MNVAKVKKDNPSKFGIVCHVDYDKNSAKIAWITDIRSFYSRNKEDNFQSNLPDFSDMLTGPVLEAPNVWANDPLGVIGSSACNTDNEKRDHQQAKVSQQQFNSSGINPETAGEKDEVIDKLCFPRHNASQQQFAPLSRSNSKELEEIFSWF